MFLDFIHYHRTQNTHNISKAVCFLIQVLYLKKKAPCSQKDASVLCSLIMDKIQEHINDVLLNKLCFEQNVNMPAVNKIYGHTHLQNGR